jgi:hypothetical protein
MTKLKWRRAADQTRGRGVTSVKDEGERLGRDPAAVWLERHDRELQRRRRRKPERERRHAP